MASQPLDNHDTSHEMAVDKPPQEETRQFTAVNGYMWTPPEQVEDSFSQESAPPPAPKAWHLPPIQPHTPPTSPEFRNLPSIASATGFTSSDAPLYPEQRTDRARSHTPPPLFETDRTAVEPEAQAAPSGEVRSQTDIRPAPRPTSKPSPVEIFPTILGVKNAEDALRYWRSRISELREIPGAGTKLPSPQKSRSPERDEFTKQQLRRISKPAGVSKSTPQAVKRPKAPAVTSRPERPSPPKARRTPKPRTNSDFLNDAWPTTQPTKHKRAPPSKKVEDDTKNWSELPDYAPPTSTLDGTGKTLKASWHGTSLDLSSDIDKVHLHPQEYAVAQALRLSCASYLFNKRKIFGARLQAIKDGKNFTKTAAQGACSIDVNKASQLWEAFDKVGWFKEELFAKYL